MTANERIRVATDRAVDRVYGETEGEEILRIFEGLLATVTADGQRKRRRGKVFWKIDPDHWNGYERHIARFKEGEREDVDSGADPRVHAAWRLLAAVAQDQHPEWKDVC